MPQPKVRKETVQELYFLGAKPKQIAEALDIHLSSVYRYLPRKKVQGCGTPAGYKRHIYWGDPKCNACWQAAAEYRRELYYKRKEILP